MRRQRFGDQSLLVALLETRTAYRTDSFSFSQSISARRFRAHFFLSLSDAGAVAQSMKRGLELFWPRIDWLKLNESCDMPYASSRRATSRTGRRSVDDA